ncbi:RidA family protein [Streptomyces sp. NPDC056910]|uniref:RidA family protein n=1 Tax=Streptomyces sp. NPDC056910 TaxID=3345964 RepID=UPI00368194AF
MITSVDTGLPSPDQPFSWAVTAAGTLFTAHGPVRPDGSIDTGPVEAQTRLTLDNLRRSAEAAGAGLGDIAQVLLFLTDPADIPLVDAVYREYFDAPYPNRCCVVVAALAVPGMRIELTAHAALVRPGLQDEPLRPANGGGGGEP